MFSFTSLGGQIDCSKEDSPGPPHFVISGQNYHRMGSLVPKVGQPPRFAQLYIYDTQNEVPNRLSHFRCYQILFFCRYVHLSILLCFIMILF
jgi:hypothetical protein